MLCVLASIRLVTKNKFTIPKTRRPERIKNVVVAILSKFTVSIVKNGLINMPANRGRDTTEVLIVDNPVRLVELLYPGMAA